MISIAYRRIKNNDLICLNGAIDITKAIKIDEELLINDPTDKLNVIGKFYQTINASRYLNSGTRLKEIVDIKAEAAKELLKTRRAEGSTITAFTSENKASNPPVDGTIIPSFSNDNKTHNPATEPKREQPFINCEQLTKNS